MSTLLEVKDVKTHFPIYKGSLFPRVTGHVHAVDGVSLSIKKGEVLGLVGESGCGKSTFGRTILQLVQATSGSIRFDSQELSTMSHSELTRLRPRFQMIFQDPYASLNPRMTVFEALAEPMLVHGLATKGNVSQKVSQLMETVGLAPRFLRKYPHEFSGGQRQRIAIARALALKPELLVADEPVSALDVSVQSQILNLLLDIRRKLDLSILFISHDLSVVRHISDRVAVMYLGKIVELGTTEQIFDNPKHPYTRALLSAIPLADPDKEKDRKRVLLDGDPPSPIHPPKGCRFNPRCPYATAKCSQAEPMLESRGNNHHVACINERAMPSLRSTSTPLTPESV